MGKKIFKLFMETMLRAAVIILAVGIVIMLALLIKTISKNKDAKNSKDTNVNTELSTEPTDPDDSTFNSDGETADGEDGTAGTTVNSTDANVLVINATGTSGVAGSWKTKLEGNGYTSVDVGNYSAGINSTTKICTSGEYDGADIAEYFTSPEMDTIDSLDASQFDMPVGDYDIVVVVGSSDIQQ
jgi:hypothetical protein